MPSLAVGNKLRLRKYNQVRAPCVKSWENTVLKKLI